MPVVKEREQQIRDVYIDINTTLNDKIGDISGKMRDNNDLKSLKRLQERLVKIIQSYDQYSLTRPDSEDLPT